MSVSQLVFMNKKTGELEIFHQVFFNTYYDESYGECGPVAIFRNKDLLEGKIHPRAVAPWSLDNFDVLGYL